jgi:hypothetical protein
MAAAVVALGAAVLVAWALRPQQAPGPCAVVSGPAALPQIPESSGLAVSRRQPGLLWSHNDSGNESILFAIDAAGALRGRVRVPIRTRDWEDMSAARCASGDCLYIGDIGDNRLGRARVRIYRVAEPAPGDAETAAPDVFDAAYADGAHNAEALFAIGTDLFIVTKDRAAGVYRAPVPPTGGGSLTFERVGQLGLEGVTDAEAARDEASVVVRTSHEAVWYRAADLRRGAITPVFRVRLDRLQEAQGEGVALDGHLLYLSSEAGPWNRGGQLLTLRCTWPE